jgi:hypothetical protein
MGHTSQENFEKVEGNATLPDSNEKFIPQNVSWQKIWFIYMFGFGSMSDLLRDSTRYYIIANT